MSNHTAVIALGSNDGDRRAHLEYAVQRLGALLEGPRASRYHETPAAPPAAPADPPYLNAVVVGRTALSARELLDALLEIERDRGRTRPCPGAPRTLDLDLILLGTIVVAEPGLEVPHPRFRERRFVLEPLAELAPDLRDPVTGRTVGEMVAEIRKKK